MIITHLVFGRDRFDLLADLADGHRNPVKPAREDDHDLKSPAGLTR